MNGSKRLLTVAETAFRTGLKPKTIYMKKLRGELEYVKIGRALRFREASIDALIDAGTVPAREAL